MRPHDREKIMESSVEDNRYAPPKAPVSDIKPRTETGGIASRSRRLAASSLDTAFMIAVMWLVSAFTPWNPFTLGASSLIGSALAAALGYVCFVLINGYLLWQHGQTLGKALLGMRIVRSDGSPASPARLFGLRYAVGSVIGIIPSAGAIYGLLDCLLIFRKSHRCLHDQIADTIVIRL
jgi:uncharacterized RDD family membrane protein YckC